jgi:hypothetical protein
MASLNIVFPDEACPTMAKLRMSFAESVVMCRIYDNARRVKRLMFDFSDLLWIEEPGVNQGGKMAR